MGLGNIFYFIFIFICLKLCEFFVEKLFIIIFFNLKIRIFAAHSIQLNDKTQIRIGTSKLSISLNK